MHLPFHFLPTKIRIVIVFLIISFIPAVINAQDDVNRLTTELTKEMHDTLRLSKLIELSVLVYETDSLQSENYIYEATKIAQKLGVRFIGNMYFSLGKLYEKHRNYENAKGYFFAASEIYNKYHKINLQSDALYQYARMYYELNMVDSSIFFHKKALELRKKKQKFAIHRRKL